jgi:hypothetical protein
MRRALIKDIPQGAPPYQSASHRVPPQVRRQRGHVALKLVAAEAVGFVDDEQAHEGEAHLEEGGGQNGLQLRF